MWKMENYNGNENKLIQNEICCEMWSSNIGGKLLGKIFWAYFFQSLPMCHQWWKCL